MSLSGRGILITRPRDLAEGFADRVRGAGGRPILFPAIEIVALPPSEALARLEQFDTAIFVSPTSVEMAMRQVRKWPEAVHAAAVGEGTRQALEARGILNVLAPRSGGDSEALLALREFSEVQGRRFLVIRGEEGRQTLGETLSSRGASVAYAACYKRSLPQADPAALLGRWSDIDAVTVFSAGTVRNLFSLLGPNGAPCLRETPMFMPHERVARAAHALGVRETVVAGPAEAALLQRLVGYFPRPATP